MFEFNADAPMKVLIEDLKNFEKSEKGWVYKFSEKNISININKIVIQGEIIKTSGFSNEILIIHDGTGKAKVTTRPQVPGDISWVNAGTQCSVVGNLVENGKLPLITADKIAKISNQVLVEMWPLEVKELRGVLTKEVAPRHTKWSGSADDMLYYRVFETKPKLGIPYLESIYYVLLGKVTILNHSQVVTLSLQYLTNQNAKLFLG